MVSCEWSPWNKSLILQSKAGKIGSWQIMEDYLNGNHFKVLCLIPFAS